MELLSELVFRDLLERDLVPLFSLRNNKKNFEYFRSPTVLSKLEHENWFSERLNQFSGYHSVAEFKGELVGIVYLSPTDTSAFSISINIDQNFQSKGLGSQLLSEIIQKAKSLNISRLQAIIHKSNVKSIKLFERFGFREDLQISENFSSYFLIPGNNS
jgi:RimJ/RimL family protein N-acetyltransferase